MSATATAPTSNQAIAADLDQHYALTAQQIASFRANGYIKLKQVLSPATLAHYGAAITAAQPPNADDELWRERRRAKREAKAAMTSRARPEPPEPPTDDDISIQCGAARGFLKACCRRCPRAATSSTAKSRARMARARR